MARRAISEKGRENGNNKKGKETLMKKKAGPLGCRGNLICENMIRKNFKKGKNCIFPSRELYESFERSFQEDMR